MYKIPPCRGGQSIASSRSSPLNFFEVGGIKMYSVLVKRNYSHFIFIFSSDVYVLIINEYDCQNLESQILGLALNLSRLCIVNKLYSTSINDNDMSNCLNLHKENLVLPILSRDQSLSRISYRHWTFWGNWRMYTRTTFSCWYRT